MCAHALFKSLDPPACLLDEIALRMSMARGVEEIMAVVRHGVRPLVGADGVTFVLRDGDTCFYADEDAISPLWKGQRFPMARCISGWAMLHREVVLIEDIYADDRIPHAAYRPTFVKSLAMVPVRDDDPVGAIGAYWSERKMPSPDEVRVLRRIAHSAAVAMTNISLTSALRAARDEAVRAKDAIVLAMADLAETRDNDTGNHIRRTQHYVRALAEGCVEHGLHAEALDAETVALLFKSAPLHDIGKIAIPDCILRKPGRLTAEEFEVMKTHAMLGSRAIAHAQANLGADSCFLRVAAEIAETHHERWDGSGYPHALKGEAIPLSGRLMAVADVYDALVSERVYKSAISHEDAVAMIAEERGRHFDPELVDVFLRIHPRFDEIHRDFSDHAA
jgi:HD-GYP domain-containing protein (c-di-GMP phosphodiesterase class II)